VGKRPRDHDGKTGTGGTHRGVGGRNKKEGGHGKKGTHRKVEKFPNGEGAGKAKPLALGGLKRPI